MVRDDLVKDKKWDEITALTKDAVKKMLGLEFAHMGINNENKEEALRGAKLFEIMFGMSLRETSKSTFAGDAFEFMHQRGPGRCGHIAIRANFVDRAISYFERMGFEFDKESITYDEKTGKAKFAYFKDEVCGFAIHLLQK
jgi:2-dehydro-3-deoxyphosphogluconate aldolase/(4S)-4-hydroxy-2-oxoglutarate aldolase